MIRRFFAGSFVVVVFVLAACSGSRTEGVESSKLPASLRGDYAVFARKCSKCHSLARPLNAQVVDDEQWVNYVNRMRRQPGSAISQQDTVPILRFLHWYSFESKNPDAGGPGPALDGGAP